MRAGCLINGKQKVVIPFTASCPEKYLILEKDGKEEFVQHCLRIQLPLAVIMTKQKARIVILFAHL